MDGKPKHQTKGLKMTQVTTYDIPADVLRRDYHGAGKAWAAVRDQQIVGLRYLGDYRLDFLALPKWVRAVHNNAEGLDNSILPTAWSSKGLSKLAEAAESSGDCPRRPKGGRYRPKELLTMARAALRAADIPSFNAYREKCRAELAAMGEVIAGMCSCTQFVVAHRAVSRVRTG